MFCHTELKNGPISRPTVYSDVIFMHHSCCPPTAGYYVPKSDGEFYQFCYVTHTGDIRGASTPFLFKPSTPTDELLTVAEDDSNSDILVVTTKTGLLEVDTNTHTNIHTNIHAYTHTQKHVDIHA